MIEDLYTDETFEPVADDVQLDDPLVARRLLIEYQRNERKAEQLVATRDAVAEPYNERIRKLDARNRELREMLLRFVQTNGKQSFPDVGSCHVAQRKPAPKIVNEAAALDWYKAFRPELVETSERIPSAALKAVVEEGELPVGVELVESEPSLTVRAA